MAKPGARLTMTEGPLIGIILRVAWPIAVSNMFQSTYSIVNAFWVGHLGKDAIAAIAASGPLFGVLVSLGSGLATAGAVLIAQYAGAKRHDMLDHVAAQTLLMVAIVALAFAAIGALTVSPLLRLIGVDPSIHDLARDYLQVRYIGMIPMFAFMTLQAMLNAVGEVRFAMRVQIGALILNMLLDPLLIFGIGPLPAFGVIGAAIATVSVQFGALIIGLYHLLSGHSALHLKLHQFKPNWPHIRVATGLGLPASIEQAIRTFSSLLLMSLAASFGTVGLAAYGVGTRPIFFWFTPMIGLSVATAAVVGQNIGAGKMERAEAAARLSAILGFVVMTVIGLAQLPFIPMMMNLLAPTAPAVAKSAATFGFICFPFLGMMTVPQALLGAFRGAGSTRQSMTISIAMQWLFQMPSAYLLALGTSMGILGIWWSYPIANSAAAILCIFWYLFGPWRKTLVTNQAAQSAQNRGT